MEEMFRGMRSHQSTVGRRVEYVNGETREYRLNEDGEWVRETKELLEITDTDDGQILIADLSGDIRDGMDIDSATINNGVLEVTFVESEDEE